MDSGITVELPSFPDDYSNPSEVDPCLVIPRPFGTPVVSKYHDREHRRVIETNVQNRLHYCGFEPKQFSGLLDTIPNSIDQDVIQWFQQEKMCVHTQFRNATRADIKRLIQINRINPLYSQASDYEFVLSNPNEFIIVAERTNSKGQSILVGMIHYYLIWYYPRTISVKRKGGLLKADDVTIIPPQKVVYICTLQTVHKNSHPQYVSHLGMESEHHTGKLLLSLACEHGKKNGMSWVLLDSTPEAVSFYRDMFGMTVNENERSENYIPVQFSLSRFNYQVCWNWERRITLLVFLCRYVAAYLLTCFYLQL